jgi:hypothetical protein
MVGSHGGDAVQLALVTWTRQMADLYNDGRHWPPPSTTRRPPAVSIDPDRFVVGTYDPLLDDPPA